MLIVGCTIDQGKGTFYVDAEITTIGHTILSIKYKIGKTIVFDDIVMKDSIGILQMIKDSKLKVIPLKIHIEFNTDSEGTESGFLKYYYGANFLAESKSFDIASLVLVAYENQDLFTWEYRNEEFLNEDKDTREEKETDSSTLKTKSAKSPSGKDEKL